jgi:hypothetical protein
LAHDALDTILATNEDCTPASGIELHPIRDPLVGQAQQRIAAPAHLNGDVPQCRTLEAQAGRLAVDRAAQVAYLLGGAFPEII